MSQEIVEQMATCTSCGAERFNFIYLRFPVGRMMRKKSDREVLFERFNPKLSRRKCKMLSIRGRLTLVRLVLGSLVFIVFLFSIWLFRFIGCSKKIRARFSLACGRS